MHCHDDLRAYDPFLSRKDKTRFYSDFLNFSTLSTPKNNLTKIVFTAFILSKFTFAPSVKLCILCQNYIVTQIAPELDSQKSGSLNISFQLLLLLYTNNDLARIRGHVVAINWKFCLLTVG